LQFALQISFSDHSDFTDRFRLPDEIRRSDLRSVAWAELKFDLEVDDTGSGIRFPDRSRTWRFSRARRI